LGAYLADFLALVVLELERVPEETLLSHYILFIHIIELDDLDSLKIVPFETRET
jgi:hypothetical protein